WQGGLDVPTYTTRSGGLRFIYPLNDDAQPRRLLGQVAADLSMGPLADLLVRDLAQADPRLDVAHLPHRDAADPCDLTERDDLPRRLVQAVALLPKQLRAEVRRAFEHAVGAP